MDEIVWGWVRTLPGFTYVPVVSEPQEQDQWEGRTGFVHRAVMDDIPDLSGHQVYACGAPIMVNSARADFTHECGLPESEIYADAFISRSEEHTSELQSLMRISYAVFCLQQKLIIRR